MATAGIVLGPSGRWSSSGGSAFLVFAMVERQAAVDGPSGAAGPGAGRRPGRAALTPPGGWGGSTWSTCTRRPRRCAQLADEVKAAKTAGETVLVETTAAACAACAEIARSMREPPLQTALADVRLVRLDVREVGASAGAAA